MIAKSEPVKPVVADINANLDAAVAALEGLLVKKAGLCGRGRPDRRAVSGRRGRWAAQLPGQHEGHAAADLRGLHEGDPDARAAGPRGADRSRQPGRSGAAQRDSRERGRARPVSGGAPDASGADAALAGDRDRLAGPVRAGGSARRAHGGCPTTAAGPRRSSERSADADASAVRVRARDQRRGRDRVAQRRRRRRRIIAGGHSLLPMMKLRLANPEQLIDINDLDELVYISRSRLDEIRIGALTRHVDLLSLRAAWHDTSRCSRDAEEVIADPVVRNRGTIGGSLCQADAAEDLSAVCAAAKASVVIRGPDGERVDRHGRVPHRPVHDRRRRRRDAHRGPVAGAPGRPVAPTRRSSDAPATSRSRPPRRRSGSTAARSRTRGSR